MTTTRARWFSTLVSCLASALLVAAPSGAFAAQHGQAAASKKPVQKGFFITGLGRVTGSQLPTAYVRDGDGGQHVVTSVVDPSATGDQGHIVYLTRQPGATKWVSHQIPGLRPMASPIEVEAHLSTDGRRVFAVFYECDGVFDADTSLSSTRLPEPTPVNAPTSCATPATTSTAGDTTPVADAIALPGHRVGVMLPDPAQANQPAIFVGQPSGVFTPGPALPTTDGVVPSQLTTDPVTNQIIVVGQGSDATNEGVYVFTQGLYEDDWVGPTLVASMGSPTSDYTIEALTADNGSTWIGLQRPADAAAAAKHSLFIVHGTPSGAWSGVIPLPHSTTHDSALRIAVNDDTGNLHAAFTRVNPSSPVNGSGVMQEARTSGWATPKFFTHWHRDVAAQIMFNTAEHAVIGYDQR